MQHANDSENNRQSRAKEDETTSDSRYSSKHHGKPQRTPLHATFKGNDTKMYDTRSKHIEGAKSIKTYCKSRAGLCLISKFISKLQKSLQRACYCFTTLTECGVQHNNSRRWQKYSLFIMKHPTEYAIFSSDKHLILNTFKTFER